MEFNRRDAIKLMALGSASLAAPSWLHAASTQTGALDHAYPFVLDDLPYSYDALSDFIDAETMNIHHTKHHAAYVNNLNKALEPYFEHHMKSLAELLTGISTLPEDLQTVVRNHGGGHANHDLFWRILSPQTGVRPEGRLAEMINTSFGSLDACNEQLRKAAMSVFGSGWAWLNLDGETLVVESSPNQDSPVMSGKKPVVGIDVWEHAYYLRYQNRRADYVAAVLAHIDWKAAGANLA